MVRLQTTYSMVLHRMHTGLYFEVLVLSPFLKTAVTLACRQSRGTCHEAK